MKVEQLMMREVRVCAEADTLDRAAQLMWKSDCGCIPVISINGDGNLVGVVTERSPAKGVTESPIKADNHWMQ